MKICCRNHFGNFFAFPVNRILHWPARHENSNNNNNNKSSNSNIKNATRLSHECIIKMIATGDVAFCGVRVLFNDNARRAPQVAGRHCNERERQSERETEPGTDRIALFQCSTCCFQSGVSIERASLNLGKQLAAQSTNASRAERTSSHGCSV